MSCVKELERVWSSLIHDSLKMAEAMSALLLPNQFMKDSLTFSCLVSILKLCYSLYLYPILEMHKKSAIVYMCV